MKFVSLAGHQPIARLTQLVAAEAGEASVDGPKGFHVWPIGSSQFTVSLFHSWTSWVCPFIG